MSETDERIGFMNAKLDGMCKEIGDLRKDFRNFVDTWVKSYERNATLFERTKHHWWHIIALWGSVGAVVIAIIVAACDHVIGGK